MSETINRVIGLRHPRDGRHWDCQCARCGSSLMFELCESCGGDGVTEHDCGEDSCCCAYPEDNVRCDSCDGLGLYPVCLSSPEWCEANPGLGRADIKRHTPEWFPMEVAP